MNTKKSETLSKNLLWENGDGSIFTILFLNLKGFCGKIEPSPFFIYGIHPRPEGRGFLPCLL